MAPCRRAIISIIRDREVPDPAPARAWTEFTAHGVGERRNGLFGYFINNIIIYVLFLWKYCSFKNILFLM